MKQVMHATPPPRGFTMIELMVTIVIVAIVLSYAVGGFGGLIARKRMEGVAADLVTDLQHARAEAVARNQIVEVTFGSGCYALHTVGSETASCASAGAGGTMIKSVTIDGGADTSMSLTPASFHHVRFDGVHGSAASQDASNAAAADAGVLIASRAGEWQLRVRANASGRVEICSPSGSMPGYAAC